MRMPEGVVVRYRLVLALHLCDFAQCIQSTS